MRWRWPSATSTGRPSRAPRGGGGMIDMLRGELRLPAAAGPRRDGVRGRRLPRGRLGRDAEARCRAAARTVTLHTHLISRDDALALYGFADRGGARAVPDAALRPGGRARRWRWRCCRRAPRASCWRRSPRATRPPAGGSRDRQAHRRADHRRAAREGRQRRCRGRAITVTRGRRPAGARPRGPDRPRLQRPRRPTSCWTEAGRRGPRS